ncbi:MAG: hypothetical protein NC923_07340 [Candidatus Omnitrophica bacterium]|nr:hypothetical protein [Candidatus Omnitrophota bacterium]
MKTKREFYRLVEEICQKDRRYKVDAYEFLMEALYFTQSRLKRKGHVKGVELTEGLRDFAVKKYGPMARTVLAHWGITNTRDFGNIVFNMIDKQLLSKTDDDSIEDFNDVYDFDKAFEKVVRQSIIDALKKKKKDYERQYSKGFGYWHW